MKRFKKVYIEITNICNLSCNFCPKTKRKYKMTDKESFKKVLEEVSPFTDHIYLHLMGEPTAHPDLAAFLEMSKDYGLKVNLTTNGTLIHKVKDVLIDSQVVRQVNISLHSFEANELEISLEKYVESICQFALEARDQANIITSIRLWNMDSEELKASNTLNKDIFKLLEENTETKLDIREELQKKPSVKLGKNIYLNMAEKFDWPDMTREVLHERAFCYGLRDQIGILVDGTVVPCCLDSEGNIPLGNVFETPLVDILESDRAKKIYEGFSNRDVVEELCKRCGYVKRYSK